MSGGHPKGMKLTAEWKRHISEGKKRASRRKRYAGFPTHHSFPTALKIVQKYHPEVTHVTDARQAVEIEVTDADRQIGRKKEPKACALARACQRVYDGAIIAVKVAYLIKGRHAVRYSTPERIARELVSFDRGHDFVPGRYRLRPPARTQRLGYRKTEPTGPHETTGTAHRHVHRTEGVRAI